MRLGRFSFPSLNFDLIKHRGMAVQLLVGDHLQKCSIAKIYEVLDHRQEWDRGKMNRYSERSSFCASLEGARAETEKSRKQGSQWIIRELPACVFRGPSVTLLITEIRGVHPLSEFDEISPNSRSLLSIWESFEPRRPDSVVRLTSNWGFEAFDGGVLHEHDASSVGADKELRWHKRPRSVNTDSIEKIYRTYFEWLIVGSR